MKIDGNEIELRALEVFHQGNREEALKIQDEFVEAFRAHYEKKDHCSCKKACKYHGKCKECVAIHRAHMDHLPNCFHPLVNKKLKLVSQLTEHSLPQMLQED